MIKTYCDKCRKEINEKQCRKISINIEYPNNKSTYITDFCDNCMDKIIDLVDSLQIRDLHPEESICTKEEK